MAFTTDWFSKRSAVWISTLGSLACKEAHALEIGCWEGRASVWMLQNLLVHPKSTLTVIDTFAGSDEHKPAQVVDLESRFDKNTSRFHSRIVKLRSPSFDALRSVENHRGFDLVYVDGSHRAIDVLADAVLAFPLLRLGGFMIFDDYKWAAPLPSHLKPKRAVNAFLSVYGEEIDLLHKGYQVIIRRKAHQASEAPRIPLLMSGREKQWRRSKA